MMSGWSTPRPMKPHTTDGIAASNSIVTFSVSFTRPWQNSETNTAAPMPNGTAITIATPVTLSVPTMSASTPYCGRLSDFGIQLIEPKNSPKFSFDRNGAPSRKTKKKMPKTKIIAEMPQSLMSSSRARSAKIANGRR